MNKYQPIISGFCNLMKLKNIKLSHNDSFIFQYKEHVIHIESGDAYSSPDHVIVLIEIPENNFDLEKIMAINANVNLTKDGYLGSIKNQMFYFRHFLIPNSPLELADFLFETTEIVKLILVEGNDDVAH